MITSSNFQKFKVDREEEKKVSQSNSDICNLQILQHPWQEEEKDPFNGGLLEEACTILNTTYRRGERRLANLILLRRSASHTVGFFFPD